MNRHNFHPAEEHAEESYLASLSDLMVGMLFFFIILLMAFALNFHAAEQKSADAEKKSAEQWMNFQVESEATKRTTGTNSGKGATDSRTDDSDARARCVSQGD